MKIFNCFAVCLALAAAQVCVTAQTGAEESAQNQPAVRIRWNTQGGVMRYRLQVSRDERFGDIVVDRAVNGTEYVTRELMPGRYFWRIAPAVGETGRYSAAQSFDVSESSSATVGVTGILSPPADTGWRTATGAITQLVTAHLRSTRVLDLVAANADGNVYALDGVSGISLWTTRFRLSVVRANETSSVPPAMIRPIIFPSSRAGLSDAVVAYSGGVRALDGASGRELWRAEVPGRIVGGCSIDANSDDAAEIYIVAASGDTPSLFVIDGRSGRTLARTALDSAIVGIAPAEARFTGADSRPELRAVVLAYADGTLETRGANGERANTVKLDTRIVTPPVIAATTTGANVIVGTESGLIALDAGNFRPAWRVATEGTSPRGTLSVTDTERDGNTEVVMITGTGRAALIGVSDGRIRWFVDGASGAESAAFADLNGDGVLDVLLASSPSFASGYAGQDGTLIWRADENATATGITLTRSLVVATYGDASVLVGNDPAGASLRAVTLPRSMARTASN